MKLKIFGSLVAVVLLGSPLKLGAGGGHVLDSGRNIYLLM